MLKFDSVKKVFADGTLAFDDLSFEVNPGEFVFLTGPSGSGKTTIMRLITREHTPTSGEITFKDYPLAQLTSSDLPKHRRKVGVVFQDFQLLNDLKAWENVALSLEIAGLSQKEISERVSDLLTLVKLEDKSFLFPKQLSGGEAQRVGIARALAGDPALIFADEPTGNLDAKTSQDIIKLLKKINQLGTTVVVATHDTGILNQYQGDRRINIDHGHLSSDTGKKTPKPKPKPEPKSEPKKEEPSKEKASEEKLDSVKETTDESPPPTKKFGFSLLGFKFFGQEKPESKQDSSTDQEESPKEEKQAKTDKPPAAKSKPTKKAAKLPKKPKKSEPKEPAPEEPKPEDSKKVKVKVKVEKV